MRRMTFDEFYGRYRNLILSRCSSLHSARSILVLGRFLETVPDYMEDYGAEQYQEYANKRGKKVAPRTLNLEMNIISKFFRCAYDWRYIDRPFMLKSVRVPADVIEWITPEEFSLLMGVIRENRQWVHWEEYILFLYLTGWRNVQAHKIKWENFDAENGEILSPAKNTKGKRSVILPLHPHLVARLTSMLRTGEYIFQEVHSMSRSGRYVRFRAIQKAAGIKPREKATYGFHDLRRGFATNNAKTVDLFELQVLMQHKSLGTTRNYVEMAHRMDDAIRKLYIPEGSFD